MLDTLFRGLFDTALTTAITPGAFVLCVGMSLLIGLLLCAMTLWRSNCTRSFAVTLAILPAVVCVVILMVNSNVGTGVAVAGAFNLVRFRSAQEIGTIMLYTALRLGGGSRSARFRTLHITIPEDLDYAGVFDPVLESYTTQYSLTQVKTTNMGSLFKLTYDLTLKASAQEKGLIDALRLRNGNLEISLCHQDTTAATL